MTISFGDEIKAVIQYNLADLQANLNVVYYEAGAGVSDSEVNVVNLIGGALDVVYANFNGVFTPDVTPGATTFSKFNSGTGLWEQFGTYAMGAPAGSGAIQQVPNVAPMVFRFLADAVGQQGRKFISGFDRTHLTDNDWAAAALTAAALYAAAFMASIAVSGGNMFPGWWNAVAAAIFQYNGSYFINTKVGTMVTRSPGRGI